MSGAASAAYAAEAERQRALVAAILAPRADAAALAPALGETGERAERGLAAYRANAEALAERALGAAFGSIRAMLGGDDFARLAAEFWRASPPQRGDVGEWGADFAGWLQAHPAMTSWPYLADCARLDFALHHNERAANASFDADSLALLVGTDPQRLRLVLMPGTALVSSRWPIVTIHRAHRSGADADFALARDAIERECAQQRWSGATAGVRRSPSSQGPRHRGRRACLPVRTLHRRWTTPVPASTLPRGWRARFSGAG